MKQKLIALGTRKPIQELRKIYDTFYKITHNKAVEKLTCYLFLCTTTNERTI